MNFFYFLYYNSYMENDLNIANSLIGEKKFSEAIEVLKKYEKENNPEVLKLIGLCYLNLEKFPEAKSAFETVVKYLPEDATSWYYLAICYDNSDELVQAKFAYNKVISLRDKYVDAYKNLGVIYLKLREEENAFNLAKKGIEVAPDDYIFYYLAGSALLSMKDFKQSIEYLEKALERNSSNVQLYCNLGTAYLSVQKPDKALENYLKAIEIDDKNAVAYYNAGSVYQIREEHSKACEFYEKAVELDDSEFFLSALALEEFKAKYYEKSIKHYSNLISSHPEKPNYRYNLVCCYEKLGQWGAAIQLLEQLVSANPKSRMMLIKLAGLYLNANRPADAKTVYERLISQGFVSDDIYYNYAMLCSKTGDLDTAERILKKVIELNPSYYRARKDLGVIFLNKRLFKYAEDEFKLAYKLAPNDADIVFEYANFMQAMARFEEATSLYDKAIELNEKNPRIMVFAALNILSMHDLKGAIGYIEKALKLMPADPFILLNAGKIYYAAKKYDKAQFVLVKAWELNQNAEIENLLALTYYAQKEYEKAITIYEKLIKEYPTNTNVLIGYAQACEKAGKLEEAKEYAKKILEIFDEMPEAKKILKRIKKLEENA